MRARIEAIEEATELAQGVAATIQNRAHAQIADLVTRCLESILDDPYTFHIHFERKRGRTEARPVFVRGGIELDPMTATGLGAVDIAAFALRVSALLLSRPPLRRVLILDEPFRFVSVNLRPRVRELLESLSRELGIQFVVVTHDPQLVSGSIVDLG